MRGIRRFIYIITIALLVFSLYSCKEEENADLPEELKEITSYRWILPLCYDSEIFSMDGSAGGHDSHDDCLQRGN